MAALQEEILRYFPCGFDAGWQKYPTASAGAVYWADGIENQS